MILSDFELSRPLRRISEQLCRVICPDSVEADGLLEAVVDHWEMSLRALPPQVRGATLAGMVTMELTAVFYPPARGRRFSRLPLATARRWYDTWWKSPIPVSYQLAHAAKALISLAYYEQPLVRERLGYHPDEWVEKVKRHRHTAYADEIRRHEDMLVAPDPLIPVASLSRPKEARHG